MRYYIDTNVLVHILMREDDSICREVRHLFKEYSNRFYVSSIAVKELIHAYKTGGIRDTYNKSVRDLFDAMDDSGIEIVPMNKHHLQQYAALEIVAGHKDPNDHIIIAQAISDKIPIISSDRMFREYTRQGLDFVNNRR